MPKKMKVTPELKSAVNAYLMARAHLEAHQAKHDQIERAVLQKTEFYTDPNDKRWPGKFPQKRILDPDKTYLLSEPVATDFLFALKAALNEAGYETKQLEGQLSEKFFYCPAITTAKRLLKMAEHVLIEVSAEILGENGKEFKKQLMENGVGKHHQQFIDLTVAMVVKSPGYKMPITENE